MELLENQYPLPSSSSSSSAAAAAAGQVNHSLSSIISSQSQLSSSDEIVNDSTMNSNDNPSPGMKRKREDDQIWTETVTDQSKATKRSITQAAATISTTSLFFSRGLRRSSRNRNCCLYQGEMQNDAKTGRTSKSSTSTSTSTASTASTTLRQPLFSFHQQPASFSPKILGTPYKYPHHHHPPPPPHQNTMTKKSTPPTLNPGILRLRLRQSKTSYPIGTNLTTTNQTTNQVHDSTAAFSTMLNPATNDKVTTIHVEAIQDRLLKLFPQEKYRHIMLSKVRIIPNQIITLLSNLISPRQSFAFQPCILPRIIAAYTLHRDYQQHDQTETETISSMEILTDNSMMKVQTNTPGITTHHRKRYFDTKARAIQRLQPIQTFLDALVDLEWDLLDEPCPDQSKLSSPTCSSKKHVHFAAYDGSAWCPPSDVTPGSYLHQQICIRNLTNVLNAINDMRSSLSKGDSGNTTSTPNDAHLLAVLQDLVSYLNQDFHFYDHDKTCALSISTTNLTTTTSSSASSVWYPSSRIEKAAVTYSKDLESVLVLLRATSSSTYTSYYDDSDNLIPNTRPFLTWECRLADVSSQQVRYWLRTLLNPVPVRAKVKDETDRWTIRIADIVTLIKIKDRSFLGEASLTTNSVIYFKASSTAVDNESISSLLSDALSHIYDYLGGIPINIDEYDHHHPVRLVAASADIWQQRLLQMLPDVACLSSELCTRGLGSGRQPAPPLSDNEWRHVGKQLKMASDFMAFFHRVLFSEQLVSILVKDDDWAAHWENTVQKSALRMIDLQKTTIVESKTWSAVDSTLDERDQLTSQQILQQEDSHLILLGMPLTEMLARLQELVHLSSDRYGVIKLNLQKTVTAFRFGTSNTKHKKQYQPQLGELEEFWNELFKGVVFPTMAMISENDEDDDFSDYGYDFRK
jgi:hypothetical protein